MKLLLSNQAIAFQDFHLQFNEPLKVELSPSFMPCLLSTSQEFFNSPYGTQYFADYAEPIPGTSTELLASVAKECKIYLIGGEKG